MSARAEFVSDAKPPNMPEAARQRDVDVDYVGGPAFWTGLFVGGAVIIGGIIVGMHDREVKPTALLKWVAAGLILHDVVWLPLLAFTGGICSHLLRRRVPGFLAWAVMTSAVLTLIAWPFVRGYGRRADVPSALQRNYAHGLLAYVGVTWLLAVAALTIAVLRRRRAGR